ncbi:hypothetical protein H0H87_000347 [Tephrocybe sp. NHM501043]|nr:hypothetical protein H0H87_000347 [Tephrocybe sp. NHM501043]
MALTVRSTTQAEAEALYMSLAVSFDSPGQSFEEARIADYLASYQSTGRPPPPCPDLPADPAARARAGLPPLFKPVPESKINPPTNANATTNANPFASTAASAHGLGGANGGVGTRITDPAQLPRAQEFAPTKAEDDTFQSVSAMAVFAGFSHEVNPLPLSDCDCAFTYWRRVQELRIYAYILGNKFPPSPIKMSPFVAAPHIASSSVSTSVSFSSTVQPGAAGTNTNGEQMMTISAQPQFAGHSLEELRVAYLRASGRELTSAEIRQLERTTATAGPTPQAQNMFAPAISAPVNPFSTPRRF